MTMGVFTIVVKDWSWGGVGDLAPLRVAAHRGSGVEVCFFVVGIWDIFDILFLLWFDAVEVGGPFFCIG